MPAYRPASLPPSRHSESSPVFAIRSRGFGAGSEICFQARRRAVRERKPRRWRADPWGSSPAAASERSPYAPSPVSSVRAWGASTSSPTGISVDRLPSTEARLDSIQHPRPGDQICLGSFLLQVSLGPPPSLGLPLRKALRPIAESVYRKPTDRRKRGSRRRPRESPEQETTRPRRPNPVKTARRR